MESKVSGFLRESMAPEIQEGLTRPALERSFRTALPLIERINKAHVVMLVEAGIVERTTANLIARGMTELESEGPEAFKLDPALEEAYFNYEAELVRRTGTNVGGRLHTARSRNDLKATVDRIRAREKTLDLLEGILEFRRSLLAQARRFHQIVAPGYTHMQPAQPITFGWYLLGIEKAIARDHDRLAQCYERLNRCPLGAGAMAGTSFPIDREMTARLLGFAGPMWHAQDAVASRDALFELVADATLLMTTIGRLAHDFYAMTMYEVGTLELPDSIAITSSIMPQKKNMAALEQLKGRAPILLGALTTAISAQKGAPFSHAQDSGLDALRWTWESLAEALRAVPIARIVVEGARPRAERMLSLARENFSTVTDLADMLVREGGLSFREAHHVVGRVVRLAMDRALKADEIDAALLDQAAQATLGRRLGMDDELLKMALDPEQAVGARGPSGGPGAAEVLSEIDTSEEMLDKDLQLQTTRRSGLVHSEQELERSFAALIGSSTPAQVTQ